MKKYLVNILLFASFALLTAPFTTSAIASITMEVETGAQIDKATAIVKNVKKNELVVVPQFKDTNFLFTGEPMSSLVIYNTAVSDSFFMVTGFGDSVVEISAENIGEGDFVAINTTEPDGCTTLSIVKCRSNPDYIGETAFSVNINQQSTQSSAEGSSFLGAVGELFGF